METIHNTKKGANKYRIVFTISLLLASILTITFAVYSSYGFREQSFRINETTIISLIILTIVVFPLLAFMLPNNKSKDVVKNNTSVKKHLLKRRRKHLVTH